MFHPPWASQKSQQDAEKIDALFAEAPRGLNAARRRHAEVLKKATATQQAVALAVADGADANFLMECSVDACDFSKEIALSARALWEAEVAYERANIKIHRDAVLPFLRAMHAAYGPVLAEAKSAEAAKVSSVRQTLALAGFEAFVSAPAMASQLGIFGKPPVSPIEELLAWHPEIAELRARCQSIIDSVPPSLSTSQSAIARSESRLRALLSPSSPAPACLEPLHDFPAQNAPLVPRPSRKTRRIGEEWSGGILN